MQLILFGAPGSGKGTQADMLADEFKLRKISLGDILRDEVKKGSDLGDKVKQYMERGDLVSDSIVAKVIDINLAKENFILDGYPRNRSQAETLDDIFAKKNTAMDAFIYLDVSQEVIVGRLTKRRVCRECRANYHLEAMPPEEDNICDRCSAGLMQRKDDQPDVIRKRWELFLENSREIFDFYKDKGIFIAVDGDKKKEEVLAEVKSNLEKRKILS